jgi:hypothetical protein
MSNLIHRRQVGEGGRRGERRRGSPGWRTPAAVLAVAAAALAVSAPSARGWEASKGPVSSRYHTEIRDIAAAPGAGLAGARITPVPVKTRVDNPRNHAQPRPRAEGRRSFRYQLHLAISRTISESKESIVIPISSRAPKTNLRNVTSISEYISPQRRDEGVRNGRLLFRLAIAFAGAYLLVLAAWFWGTRARSSRVGGVARY